MNGFNVYCDSNLFSPGTISTAILNFFGVSVAVGSLFLLVLAAHPAMSARGLESKSCETKFWSVKGFVMLMFYQSIMVALVWKPLIGKYFLPTATWNSVQLKQALLNFATLIDLVLFALLHLRAYKYSVYIPKSRLDEPANNVSQTSTVWFVVYLFLNFLFIIEVLLWWR